MEVISNALALAHQTRRVEPQVQFGLRGVLGKSAFGAEGLGVWFIIATS